VLGVSVEGVIVSVTGLVSIGSLGSSFSLSLTSSFSITVSVVFFTSGVSIVLL